MKRRSLNDKNIPISKLFVPFFVFSLLLIFPSCSGKEDRADEVSGATWQKEAVEKPPLAVEAVVASQSKLVPVLHSSGSVAGIKEALIVAQTQGIIDTIDVEIGDSVKRGDYLLSLRNNIERSNYEKAKIQYDNAYLNLQAVEQSFKAGGSSKSDLLRAQGDFNGSKALFDSARKAYDDNNLRSLIDGTVAWKADGLEVGNLVFAGSLVYRITDLSSIRVKLSLGEKQIGLISKGGKAFVNVPAACGDKWAEGEIVAVAGGSDSATGSYSVIVHAPNICKDKIKAGMTAKVRMETDAGEVYFIVPRSAIVYWEGKPHLYVEKEGKAWAREIVTGDESGNRIEVISGVDSGEMIITTGLTALRSGDPVTVTPVGKSSEIE